MSHGHRGIGVLLIVFFARVATAQAGLAFSAAEAYAPFGISSPDPLDQSARTSLPAGTALFVRLDTPVSTQSSHLHTPIAAHVIREVAGANGIVIPLGAIVRGSINKLIPNSSPSDRARLRIEFNSLEIPGQAPHLFTGHLTEVENARESLLADGTIQGVLANELPLTGLDKAIARLGDTSDEARKIKEKYLGKISTIIELPTGADLRLTLDKPLELYHTFSSAISGELSLDIHAAIDQLLAGAPHRVSAKDGNPGDPLNLVFIGNEAEIRRAFEQAAWMVPEKSSDKSIWQTIRAAVGDRGYEKAPISDLVLFGKTEDLAFEKMLNTFAKRHHLRLWRSPAKAPDGREIWLAAATHDNGFDVRPNVGVMSHAIDPSIDLERDKVGSDLIVTGNVAAEQLVTRSDPLSTGLTASGVPWKTDGYLRAIILKAH